MAKKRLTIKNRELILEWMLKTKAPALPVLNKLEKQVDKLCSLINPVIRAKYPENEMEVLRKYKCVRKDDCLKFHIADTGRVFGIDLSWYRSNLDNATKSYFKEQIADMPEGGGCNSNVIFEGSENIEEVYNKITSIWDDYRTLEHEKSKQYYSFLYNCRYVEEVEEVFPLPEEMRVKLYGGEVTAISLMNPELIASIKSEFAA